MAITLVVMAMRTTTDLRFLEPRRVILAHWRLLILSVAIFPFQSLLSAQAALPVPLTKPPQLKLEITAVKKTYFVGETLFVKYKLTSLADGTLCFPPPAPEAHQSVTGYLATKAYPTTLDDGDRFIEGFWERDPTDEQLRSNVTNQWVKLGMSEPYKPKRAGKVTVLTEPGEWVVQSIYVPPALTTGQRVIVESLGCTPSDARVLSSPTTVTVINAPK